MEPSRDQVGTKWDQMKLGPMGYPKKVDFSLILKCFLGTSWGPNGDQVGPSQDQVGTKWDQVGAKWDQVEGPSGTRIENIKNIEHTPNMLRATRPY